MNLLACIQEIYPEIKDNDFLLMNNGNGSFIKEWHFPQPQPSKEELQAVWEQIKDRPVQIPLNPIDELKKQQTDLLFELMLKGVL